jgi:uncharacterized membrane protein
MLGLPETGLLALMVVLADLPVPGLTPVAGLWLCIVLPTLLLWQRLDLPTSHTAEGLVYSLAITLLALMLGGLALNQVLPLVGIDRPLDRIPVMIALVLALALLAAWRRDEVRALPRPALDAREWALVGLAALVVVGAVAGAIRLNNGASGALALGVLVVAALIVVGLLVWRERLDESAICAVLYLLALALMLMTSLRGWYIVGHDIQQEFHALGLTSVNGAWDVSLFREPYNACLSITILPALIGRVAHLHDPYVLKVVIPFLFAVCPVLVYRIARRFVAVAPAVLSAVYFMAFPTFFTDMPFLTRQQVAFIFLGAGFLVITAGEQPLRRRRGWLAVMAVGVVFSHYSTIYVLLGVMAIALLAARIPDLMRVLRRSRAPRPILRLRREPLVVTWPIVLGLGLLVAIWTGPLTGTSGQLEKTVLDSAQGIVSGDLLGNRSSDVSYSLLAGQTKTLEERIAEYRAQTIEDGAAGRAAGTYYPLSVVERYPTVALEQPDLPVTSLGDVVESAGVSVPFVNSVLRAGFARLLQVFVIIGLVVAGLGLVQWFRVTHEFFLLAAASFGVVITQVLLPALTVEYGLLRSVQQGLFVLAPFLVAGSIAPFIWLGLRRATTAAAVIGTTFFLSLTGVLPTLLGGYPAQLHLENSGEYYDLYYVQPQERAALAWLSQRVDPSSEVQSELQSDRYRSADPAAFASFRVSDDIYPTFLRPDAFVFLGESVVQRGTAALPEGNDRITYRYPRALLDAQKDLVYNSAGGAVYR